MALSKITNLSITDDTILNADIKSSAAIALSKLATDPSNATNLASGTVPTARLGSGTASSSTVLNGDQTYKTEPGGLTEVDQWRLTTAFQDTAQPIASNWERNDTEFEKIGTGLTESSGVFSFASTGVYMKQSQTYITLSSATSSAHFSILVTINDADYNTRAYTQVGADTNRGDACMCQCYVDVTDVANVKFKIQTNGGTYITWNGHSSQNETTITVIRLGDT